MPALAMRARPQREATLQVANRKLFRTGKVNFTLGEKIDGG